MDRVLWFAFAATRGGPTRVRIVEALLEVPRNVNMLAQLLGLNYKTVEYNLRVLTKQVLVVCDAPRTYGALYRPSKNLLAGRADFEVIRARLLPKTAPNLGKPTSTETKQEARQ